jgi:hypothetical protein
MDLDMRRKLSGICGEVGVRYKEKMKLDMMRRWSWV